MNKKISKKIPEKMKLRIIEAKKNIKFNILQQDIMTIGVCIFEGITIISTYNFKNIGEKKALRFFCPQTNFSNQSLDLLLLDLLIERDKFNALENFKFNCREAARKNIQE